MSTELTVVQRAVVALGYDEKREKELKELAKQSSHIKEITNKAGYDQVHSARMALKNTRVEIQRCGKEARDDATKFSKAVIAEEKRLIGLIESEEGRLERLQEDWDAAREAERQAAILAEERRQAGLQERVAELRGNRALTAMSGAALIAKHLADVEAINVDESFQEFQQQAEDAKVAGIAWLKQVHAAAIAHEAEQKRIKEEREELARLRAEQAKRDAEERVRIAEDERKAKAEREAEAAKQAEILRAERAKLDLEIAAKAKRDAAERAEWEEQKRQEIAKREAEEKALAAQRAAFESEQAEARRKAEEEERQKALAKETERKRKEDAERIAKKSRFPGIDSIVQVLADHYGVTTEVSMKWIVQLREAA